jgi:hypothetical protein
MNGTMMPMRASASASEKPIHMYWVIRAEDQADADARADGGEAVSDRAGAAVHAGRGRRDDISGGSKVNHLSVSFASGPANWFAGELVLVGRAEEPQWPASRESAM